MPRLETDPPQCPDDNHDWDDQVILTCQRCYKPADIGSDACSRGLMEVSREYQRKRQMGHLVSALLAAATGDPLPPPPYSVSHEKVAK